MNKSGITMAHPFVTCLFKDHAYHTPRLPEPAFLATWRYYKGIARVIVDSTLIARKGRFDNQAWFDRSYYTVKLIEKMGGTLDVSGLEHLANRKGPVVFVSNHMSLLETFLFPSLILPFMPVSFVIKKELTEYPGFGKAMSSINHIAVSRTNPRADFRTVMEKGQAFLEAGISVLIFPQATRNTVFIPAEFNTLGEKLAAKAGVPLIPAAVKTDMHGNGRLFKEFGPINPALPVRVVFGPPVDPQTDGRQTHEKIIRFIGDQLRTWSLPVQDSPPEAPATP